MSKSYVVLGAVAAVVSCLCIVGALPAFADNLAPKLKVNLTITPMYYDISSSARVDLLAVAHSGPNSWAAIDVTPAADSGRSFLHLVRTKISIPGRPSMAMSDNTFGTYTVRTPFGSNVVQQTGNYFWRTYYGTGARNGLLAEEGAGHFEAYPDSRPRTILCQIDESVDGMGKFTSPLLVPDDCLTSLKPAVDYVRQHPELETSKQSATVDNQLTALLNDKNPYLVIAAAQILLSEDKFTDDDFQVVLQTQNARLIGSVLADAVVCQFQSPLRDRPCLRSSSVSAASMAQLEGITLGLAVARSLCRFVVLYKGAMPPATDRDLDADCEAMTAYTVPMFKAAQDRLQQLPENNAADPRAIEVDNFSAIYGR